VTGTKLQMTQIRI